MNYLHYVELPLKLGACWQWFPEPTTLKTSLANKLYLAMVLFFLVKAAVTLSIHLYKEWVDIMSCLHELADSLPLLVSIVIVSYYAVYRKEFHELMSFMKGNFKYNSAQGLTNMTMCRSYESAKKFAKIYTACTMFSVTMYVTLPVVLHLWTKEPINAWIYSGVTKKFYFVYVFLEFQMTQWFVGLAMGQFGVFFAANSILICGQLELLCCSLRNLRYTALLQHGVTHAAVAARHGDIQLDEMHGFIYNQAEMVESEHHYDERAVKRFEDVAQFVHTHAAVAARHGDIQLDEMHGFIYNQAEMVESEHHYDERAVKRFEDVAQFDIYSRIYDDTTMSALRDCAVMCQAIMEYKDKFERFVSPLLVLRVVQVTLYLCTLLYAATLNFDMMTAEYLAAVALDIFVYCYYGNQIILQADRVSTSAYQCSWPALGVRPRRVLLSLLLANKRPVVVRAGRFLPMDLHTFVVIIKTSFSYYTLLVNVNEK